MEKPRAYAIAIALTHPSTMHMRLACQQQYAQHTRPHISPYYCVHVDKVYYAKIFVAVIILSAIPVALLWILPACLLVWLFRSFEAEGNSCVLFFSLLSLHLGE